MTANFVDQFGFNDEEFTDHDDSIGWVTSRDFLKDGQQTVVEFPLSFCRATFDRIAEININIDAGQDTVSLNKRLFQIIYFMKKCTKLWSCRD